MDFKGKTAIITGAAKGIGRGCAETLASNGANVVIADMNYEMALKVQEELLGKGLRALAVQVDVSDVSDLQKMVDEAVACFGDVHILINNAGIFHSTPIEEITEKEWDTMSAINLKSVFFATQKVLPYMIKNNYGKIINISSLAGRNGGVSNGLCYSATKAGIIGLSKGFASRLAKYKINVNTVAPGSTNTGILDNLSEEEIKRVMASIPLGRFGETQEIVSAVVYLCTNEASFITGAILDVNGGMYFSS